MNPRQLEIANLAAEHDFGKTELAGYYHNEAINFMAQKLRGGSSKVSLKQIIALGEKYFLSLPENTFGKITRKNYEAIIREATEVNYDSKNVSLTWKNNPALSAKANEKLDDLFKLLRSFQKNNSSVKEIKEAFVSWQRKIGKLSETESAVLSVAGSIARYSAAYWAIKEPVARPGSPAAKKNCVRTAAIVGADVLFGVAGAVAGSLGGVAGAVAGGVAFGALGSGWVGLGPARKW